MRRAIIGHGRFYFITRTSPRLHHNWLSITFHGRRYQLFGGIRTPEFINLDMSIGGTK